jgi:hypothetical protein
VPEPLEPVEPPELLELLELVDVPPELLELVLAAPLELPLDVEVAAAVT